MLLNFIASALAYSITLGSRESFCFNQETVEGAQLTVNYYAVAGGNLQIAGNMTYGNETTTQADTPSGSFYVKKTEAGKYNFCFFNTEDEDKSVTFFVIHQQPPKEETQYDSITTELYNIHTIMSDVHRFQRMRQQVERRLQTVMQTIKSSVTGWTLFKFAVIVACAAWQVWTFKKFFAKKRTAV